MASVYDVQYRLDNQIGTSVAVRFGDPGKPQQAKWRFTKPLKVWNAFSECSPLEFGKEVSAADKSRKVLSDLTLELLNDFDFPAHDE